MENTSLAPLLEEQLDLTFRQLLKVSASLTPDEIKSICQRLGHMYHTMADLLVTKSLELNGVASTGHLGLINAEGTSLNAINAPRRDATNPGSVANERRVHQAPALHESNTTRQVGLAEIKKTARHIIDTDDYSSDDTIYKNNHSNRRVRVSAAPTA